MVNAFSNRRYPSTSHLHKLFDASLDVICSIDKKGRFIEVSGAALQVWGYQPEELIGRLCTDLVIEEDLKLTEEAGIAIRQGASVIDFENRYRHKDGRIVPIGWSAQWDPKEEVMFCIARDISGKRSKELLQARYEQQVQRQHAEMNEMLQRITDGFFAVDREWRFVYGNRQVEAMLNIKVDDYLGKSFWDCFPGMVGSVYEKHYRWSMQTKEPVHFEAYFPPFSKWLSVNAYPSHSGLSVFFQDITGRRRVEEELRNSNERFQLAAKFDAIYDWDLATNIIQWGEGLQILFGYQSEELQIDQWAEVLFVEDRKKIKDSLCMAIEDPAVMVWKEEYQLRKKNGAYCYVFERGHIVRDSTGKAVRMVGILQDITDRVNAEAEQKKYEQKVIQQDKQLVSVLERMNQGFFSLDRELKVLYWNRKAEEILNISREEILGKEIVNFYKKEALQFYQPLFMRAALEQQAVHSEHLCPQTGRWTEVNIYPAEEGFSVFFKDIHAKKQSEEEIQRLSLIAQQTSNIVIISSPAGAILWVNDAFSRITGYQRDEVLGKDISTVLDGPETDPYAIQLARQKFKASEPFSFEVINYKKDSSTYWAAVTCHPVFDDEGRVQHFFSVSTDITERKQLQLVLDEEKRQRQQMITAAAIQAQERERALVSQELHDNVNQVLTTVKLYTELCRDGIGNTRDTMDKSIRLLQDSINEIRSLSKRLSAPSLGNIKLKDSIKELVDTIVDTNKIMVAVDVEGIEGLEVDQDMHLALYRILQEHFTNILKHAEAELVEVRMEAIDELLIMQVKDNGKGFDTAQQRKGIGIANMITRAESLHGTLVISSLPGKGCQLTVQFPLDENTR